MGLLTVNVGSSSIKIRLLGADDAVVDRIDLPDEGGRLDRDRLARAVAPLADRVEAVGHRVVHGGRRFTTATIIDPEVTRAMEELSPLAPLHQDRSLAAVAALLPVLPGVPVVACFDTAFFAGMPDGAATYAVPEDWRARLGVRRYGFHGLSHAWASRRAAQLLERKPDGLRVVSCHLGSGASAAAVVGGRAVDTTMGFTPLEGLVMATRSGSVDAGLVPWLVERAGMTVAEVAEALEQGSGLVGLAGTAEMAEVTGAADRGEPRAVLAVGVTVHRLRAAVASMAAAMEGLDCLVFTGGVGEGSAPIRAQVTAGLGFLGVGLDEAANAGAEPDVDVSGPGTVRTLVVAAREDLEMAREVRTALGPTRP